jgi:homoserine kinase
VKAAAIAAGALGCSISGSGPSVFALCASREAAEAAGAAMVKAFGTAGLACDLYLSGVNREGPVVLEGDSAGGTGGKAGSPAP